MGPAPVDWWQAAFGARYLDVYAHRDGASARREVHALIELGLSGRVLDLCCGAGRHTREMRAFGLDAFGLDWSPQLLARAIAADSERAELADAPRAGIASRSAGSPLDGRVVRADMRALPFAAAAFDSVACLFNSFGYFDDRANACVLEQVRDVLRRDGRLFLDLMNAARVRATLVPRSERVVGGARLVERRWISADGRRVEKEVALAGGEQWIESVRLYEPDVLERELARAGLAIERTCGDWDGRAFAADAPRMLVVARRAA